MTNTNISIRVLIVEDHIALAENLYEFFADRQYVLDFASDGLTGLHLATCNQYDIIILDVMLPGINGFELCRRLREDIKCNVPILMLTAKSSIDDKKTGFTQGADDYLTKPFDLRELELRISALTRRNRIKSNSYEAGDFIYTPGMLLLEHRSGVSMALFGISSGIFELLIKNYPNFITHQQIMESIWGEDEVDLHTVRTHISAMRKMFKEKFGQNLIASVHGKGYCLRLSDGES